MFKVTSSERGQTLVEFALTAIILLVLIFGIIEFSFIMYDKSMITRASREGARAGAVFRADSATFGYAALTAAEVRSAVNSYLQNRLITFGTHFNAATDVVTTWSTDGGTTWVTSPPSQHNDNAKVRVQVSFSYRFLVLPAFTAISGGAVPLSTKTIMRME